MKYEYLEDIAIADIAFKAYGRTLKELFENAAEAVFEVMVDVAKIDVRGGRWVVKLKEKNLDNLLYDFLSELVSLKDERGVVLGKFEVEIRESGGSYELRAEVFGDKIDSGKFETRTDVKAVTLHMFGIEKTKDSYRATVVLDV